jgi:hypothetical protein
VLFRSFYSLLSSHFAATDKAAHVHTYIYQNLKLTGFDKWSRHHIKKYTMSILNRKLKLVICGMHSKICSIQNEHKFENFC